MYGRIMVLLHVKTLPGRFLPLVFAFAVTSVAHAQIGIYATYDAQHASDKDQNLAAGISSSPHTWQNGPTFGFYDDYLHAGPIRLGTDVRYDILHGDGSTRQGLLLGLRLAVKPPVLPIKPYIQASAGFEHTSHSNFATSGTNGQYRIAGGVDWTLLPRFDWRVVEVGRGSLFGQGSTGITTNALTTLSSGFVFRLP